MAYKVFTNGSTLQASELNENLMQQSVATFSNAAARSAAITSPVEGQITYLQDDNLFYVYDSSSWVILANGGSTSYSFVETVYFTSNGTFTKATYPWLRAIKVRCQGAGGGAGAAQATSALQHSQGASGAGGAYAESFITDIASLDASVTVTIGAGGTGGTTSPTTGNAGGNSSFGALVSANGGSGNTSVLTTTFPNWVNGSIKGEDTATGDLVTPGGSPASGIIFDLNRGFTALGGSSFLGSPNRGRGIASNGFDGLPGLGYGSGGSGPGNGASQATVRIGGDGAPGIVILELFA